MTIEEEAIFLLSHPSGQICYWNTGHMSVWYYIQDKNNGEYFYWTEDGKLDHHYIYTNGQLEDIVNNE